jgi:hypothetical protein
MEVSVGRGFFLSAGLQALRAIAPAVAPDIFRKSRLLIRMDGFRWWWQAILDEFGQSCFIVERQSRLEAAIAPNNLLGLARDHA